MLVLRYFLLSLSVFFVAPDSYVHRSGRTGRAGRPGVAVTLYAENEIRDIRKIEQGVGQGFRFERGSVPSAEQVMSLAGTVAREQIKGVSDEMVEFFRESAQELLEEEESEVRVAMAVATGGVGWGDDLLLIIFFGDVVDFVVGP